jgi:hypothetical protein
MYRHSSVQTTFLILALAFASTTFFAQGNDTAKANQIAFTLVPQEKVQERLNQYKGNDTKREAALRQMFLDAGCGEANVSEQLVPDRKQPNVICALPGTGEKTIVVGAHFDHVSEGQGIVDNWSGASLLPSLMESLRAKSRKHTFIFVGFTGEEEEERGSEFYVKHLPEDQVAKIAAMVNMDTLGLGPTEVWVSRSDPELVLKLRQIAQALKLPLGGMNVDKFGQSDEERFIKRNVCTITVHSLTPETMHVLHHSADNPSAIHFSDYYSTYRLLAAYLAMLDDLPMEQGRVCKVAPLAN